jgi:hypothetical protein
VIGTGGYELLAPQLSGVLVGELGAQAAPGAVQALTESRRRHAERGGGLGGREPVPRHERERLSITLSQDSQRGQDAPVHDLKLAGVAALDVPALGPEPQPLAPRSASPLGSDDVARNGEQPRQRHPRHIVKPPPDDQERLGDDVIDILGRHPAPGVRPDRGMVFTEQRVKARSPDFRI